VNISLVAIDKRAAPLWDFYSHLGLYNRPDFGLCKEADRALLPLTVVP
jgi:hypothetical protein